MEVSESYRVLELEIGASRIEVDAAFCRLLERWHPDRVVSTDAVATSEAQRMVKAINEAYQTLSKISPNTAKPATAAPTSSGTTPTAAVKSKPKLPPLVGGQPSLSGSAPPKPPPPPETWAARSASTASVPPTPSLTAPPITLAAPPPPTKPLPPAPPLPTPRVTPSAATQPPLAPPPRPASTPATAPTPNAPAPTAETPTNPPTAFSEFRTVAMEFYDSLFPVGTPRRRFGPVIVTVALIVLLLLAKCAFPSTSGNKIPPPPDPKTIGRLIVKSNLANTTIEAVRLPTTGETEITAIKGSDEGGAEQSLSNLTPGKYVITARSTGWQQIKVEANVDAGATTEVPINFKGGSLRLESIPAGATVRLGAAVLGRTPLTIPLLAPGECQLTLDYPSWPSVLFKTTISAGQEATGSVRLPHGKLTIESRPTGATVLLGGKPLGLTPLTIEQFSAGTKKLTLRAKEFPPLEITVAMADRGEVKLSPTLALGFPLLDPAALLRSVWVADDPDRIAPPLEGVTGPFQPQNGIVRNLNRKRLFENWLSKRYRFTAIVKSYDQASGQIEFSEQQTDLSKYRVRAKLSIEARQDPNLTAQLIKGATFALYGPLTAVEEPRWPSKVITFEFTSAEPLR